MTPEEGKRTGKDLADQKTQETSKRGERGNFSNSPLFEEFMGVIGTKFSYSNVRDFSLDLYSLMRFLEAKRISGPSQGRKKGVIREKESTAEKRQKRRKARKSPTRGGKAWRGREGSPVITWAHGTLFQRERHLGKLGKDRRLRRMEKGNELLRKKELQEKSGTIPQILGTKTPAWSLSKGCAAFRGEVKDVNCFRNVNIRRGPSRKFLSWYGRYQRKEGRSKF